MLELPDWKVLDGILVRECLFADFAAAIKFVDRLAALAEQANHHPDIDIRYNRVRLGLKSHDVGLITSRDEALARSIETLLLELTPVHRLEPRQTLS